MVDVRDRLPDRAQIEAIASVPALEQLLQDINDAKVAIEAQLEFSTRDEEWEARAIGALTAHRICEHHIRRQINRLSGRVAHGSTTETAALTKAQNVANQALLQAAAARRKEAEASKIRLLKVEAIRKAIDKSSYLAAFHRAAHQILGEEVCRQLHTDAQRAVSEAVEKMLEDAEHA